VRDHHSVASASSCSRSGPKSRSSTD
jgi:hypothetical protein